MQEISIKTGIDPETIPIKGIAPLSYMDAINSLKLSDQIVKAAFETTKLNWMGITQKQLGYINLMFQGILESECSEETVAQLKARLVGAGEGINGL